MGSGRACVCGSVGSSVYFREKRQEGHWREGGGQEVCVWWPPPCFDDRELAPRV